MSALTATRCRGLVLTRLGQGFPPSWRDAALGVMIISEFERLGKATFAGLSVEVIINTIASPKIPLACRAWPVYRWSHDAYTV
eukprot:6907736-Pyramimonas_sp.AAC.1